MTDDHKSSLSILGEVTAKTEQTPLGPGPQAPIRPRLPMGRLILLLARLTRPGLTIALSLPVLWGAGLAHWYGAGINGWILSLLLLGNAAACIGLTIFGQYQDYRRARRLERMVPGIDFNDFAPARDDPLNGDLFALLYSRVVRPGTARSVAFLALSLYLLTYGWLGLLAGWPLWFFGGVTLLAIVVALWEPIRYGQRLWIVGDLGVFLGLGILPGVSALYAQAGVLGSWDMVAASIPALVAWLAFSAYSLLTWRRDWKLRRGTLCVSLGPERALDVAAILSVASVTLTLVLIAVGALPLWSLLALGALPLLLRAFANDNAQPLTYARAVHVAERAAQAALLSGLLWLLAFWNA